MPPIEPPATQNSVSMPSASTSAACARTMSRIVTIGKERPQGWPVSGLVEAGPVVPVQPPTTLAQITKKRSVSIGLPGPTIAVHQPPLPVIGIAARDMLVAGQGMADQDGVRPGRIQFAIGLVGDLPVSSATPQSISSGVVGPKRATALGGRWLPSAGLQGSG